MKRKFTFLIAAAVMLLTMMATTGTMWGQTRTDQTVSWTATSGALGNGIGSGTISTGTYSWNYTRTLVSGVSYTGWSSSCIQLGKNGGVENLTLSTSNIPGTIKSVSVECSSYQGKHNVSITVGGSTYLASTATPSWTTVGTKTGTGTSSGTITISFTGGTRALYIKSISVTYEEGGASYVATPTFSPATGTYPETQNVTISCDTEGATIYYTLDGNDPTTSSSIYSTSLPIAETTTIKAIGVKDGMNNSSVATATYTIVTPFTSMEQIFADATENTSAHQVFITFGNWVITGNNGNNPTTAFLSDGTNGCRIYNNSGVGFAKGNILSGTASCNLSLYYGMAQLNLTSAASGLTIQTGGEVSPVVTTIDALTGDKAGCVVTVQNLTYNGSNLTDGENTITLNNYMYGASLETDHVYNVTGIFEYGYNSVKRINPRDENDIKEVIITTPTISASNVDIECTATEGEIVYTINNPVDGGSLSATTESDWLNLSNNFESPIAFTCSSNTATEERSATVTLTYTYNAKASVSKNVTVTQAAYEAPNVTWDLSTDQTATATTTEMTWTSNYVTMAVAKGSASTNTNNYYPGTSGQNYTSTRFYKNSILTITPVSGYELSSIEFTATTENYATTLKNSTWTNATASVSSTIVTVTPTDGTTAISATIGGTCGFTSVKVYYTESSDPSVATTVTIDASGITNTDVYTSTEAGSLSATVHAGETLIDGASVTWESSNTAAATIDENGVVTLVAAGSTTITASYAGVANQYKPSSTTYELTVINSNAPGTENNPYTVADAMAAIDAQGTINEAYVTGIISQVDSYNSNYKSITYWISDDGATTTQLEVYSGKGLNGADFSSINDVQVGATVVVYGNLKKHNNTTYEFDYNNYLTSYTAPQVTVEAPTFSPAAGTYASAQEVEISCETDGATIYYTLDGTEPTEASTPYNGALNIETTTTVKAIAYKNTANSYVATATYHICSAETPYTVAQALAFNEYPTSTIWVHGIVSTAPTTAPSSGQLKYYISDNGEATNELYIYNGKGLNNAAFTAQDDIQVGDIVTITGIVKDYQGTLEFDSGNYLTSFERPTVATPTFTPEEGEYTEAQSVTIACETAEATIYYTTDGSDPTASSTLYETAIPVATTTTIKAIAIKEGMSNSAVATATYTITIAPTASIEIEPASLSVDADAHEETFTVAYVSVDADLAEIRTCDEGGNDVSYDWFSATFASTTDHNNITCTIAANDGDARTAYFKVYALDDNAEDVYSNLVTINQAAYIAPSQEVVDVLDLEFTGVTGSSYEYWSDMTGNSGATYAGNSAGGNESIQLRSKNSSGIVTTTSGGKVTKVEVTWNENTEDGRTLNIYGSNTAYEATSDLYGDNAGTLIGTIIKGTSTELTISDEYTYIGFRSANNAMYLNEIQITWSTGSSTEPSITVADATVEVPAEGEDNGILALTYANLTIIEQGDFDIQYYDENGDELGKDDQPDWMEASIQAAAQEGYEVSFGVVENDGEARTAYFKVYALDDNAEYVYSNLVTISQAAYVAPVATITVYPLDIQATAAETVDWLAITLENIDITEDGGGEFDLVFCDNDGNPLSEKPAWFEFDFSFNDVWSMPYTILANTETTARTLYFKIYGLGDDGETEAYSDLVTVTQAGFVVDFAELPFEWEGGTRSAFEALTGTSTSSVGDYAESHGLYRMKLDGDGDYIQVKTDSQPGVVTIGVKMIGGDNTSTITVQGSVDGETFDDGEALEISGNQNDIVNLTSTRTFGENVRYVKLYFTKGSNVGVGPITIAPVDNTPSVSLNSYSIEATSVATNGSLTATYNNIETVVAGVAYYESDGTTTTTYNWFTATINATDNTSVDYVIAENDDEERTAYFKVYATVNDENIYSELVTVTQAAYIPPVPTTTYTLATSIESGLHYIITNGTNKAMGVQNNNNRAAVAITIENYATTITEDAGVYEIVINGPDANGKYTIYDKQYPGYLYAASSSSNHLKTRESNSDGDSQWTIEFETAGNVIITATGNNTRNLMRYNNGSTCFSCYDTNNSQQNIYLYVKENDTDYEYYGMTMTYTEPTIPAGETLTVGAGSVMTVPDNFQNNDAGALIIGDGGQLIHPSDVQATVQKSVAAYTAKDGDGWYLIASPVDELSTSGLITEPATSYDLFAYNEATAYWWSNTGGHDFSTLSRGQGYLYANANNIDLDFAGLMIGTETEVTKTLSFAYDGGGDLKGYNLMGNPFSRNLGEGDITLGGEDVTSVLLLNNDSEYQTCNFAAGGVIKPGQGFFIQATDGDKLELKFNPSSTKDANEIGLISIEAGDESYIDKAFIQFGGGNTLRKMTFSGDKSMVYVMNDDLDYAAARVEELAGTMPVHFVPIEDGFYTITVETKNIENLNYMHLIDNIKNTEIDLLVEPSYTFKASESDNADRFYLVFDFNNYTGVNENYTNDNFAHQIGDEIFVSGEGTLQVFDVLGRFVTGYNVNGDKRISTAEFNTGVYIFRMVGTKVKTQKIIVR